jgi:hypothetical protein
MCSKHNRPAVAIVALRFENGMLVLSWAMITIHAFVPQLSSRRQHHPLQFPPSLASEKRHRLDKGFKLFKIGSSIVPLGRIVQTAKESWKFVNVETKDGRIGSVRAALLLLLVAPDILSEAGCFLFVVIFS